MVRFSSLAVLVGLVYFSYFLVAISAIVSLSVETSLMWPVEFALWATVSTTSLHFFFQMVGFFMTDYNPYPVNPQWIFVLADTIAAGALGAASVTILLDGSTGGLPLSELRLISYVVTSAAATTQVVCFFKTMVLFFDVSGGRRDDEFGQWVENC